MVDAVRGVLTFKSFTCWFMQIVEVALHSFRM